MKYKIILLFSLGIGQVVLAQKTVQYRQLAVEKAIPQIITATFKVTYPDALVYNWYITQIAYWYEDYSGGWYNGWYSPRPVIVYNYAEPAYYEVEFSNEPGEVSRAIYNRYGYWFETRTKLSGLPMNVVQSLKESKYADWNWSQHKERIEAPGMPGAVYRLKVSKGMRSVIVRFDDLGQLIQAKEQDYMHDGDPNSNKGKREKSKKKNNEN
jgi:hypothetical protein